MKTYLDDVKSSINLNQNLPLNEIIYEGLRRCIITGIIPVGARINEKQYAEMLNISRTPIRESIRRIQFEGLLEHTPRLGTIVTKVTTNDVHEIFELRIALETLCFKNAMKNLTSEQLNFLEKNIQDTYTAYNKQNFEEVVRLSTIYNETIQESAKMPRLSSLLNNLKDYLIRFRDMSMNDTSRGKIAIDEHAMILRALKNKDEELIEMITVEHINGSKQAILRIVESLQQAND